MQNGYIRKIRKNYNFSFGTDRSKMSVMDIEMQSRTDSDSPWGPRIPVTIDAEKGQMIAGDSTRPIDVHGDVSMALSSYLSMVYELRNLATGVIPLRQEDVLALANAFEMDETHVAEKLARLMHCDDLQTRRFVQMVKKGRVLVPVSMVATGAILSATLLFSSPVQQTNPSDQTRTRANVEVVSTTTLPVAPQVKVDIGEATQVKRTTVSNEVSETANNGPSVSESDSAPDVGPGEVVIGEGISVSRDD